MEPIDMTSSMSPRLRRPRRLNPNSITTTAPKNLIKAVVLPPKPLWSNMVEFIKYEGLKGDLTFARRLVADLVMTDVQKEEVLRNWAAKTNAYLHPYPVCYSTAHARANHQAELKGNSDTFDEFMRGPKGDSHVRVGFFDTWVQNPANKKDEVNNQTNWHCWVVALIDNPDNKPGKHMLLFDCDMTRRDWPRDYDEPTPLCKTPKDNLEAYRPRDWLVGPQRAFVDFCRNKTEANGERVQLEDLWLGDCAEKNQNLCLLTAFRFVEEFLQKWGNNPWNEKHPLLQNFRRLGRW